MDKETLAIIQEKNIFLEETVNELKNVQFYKNFYFFYYFLNNNFLFENNIT